MLKAKSKLSPNLLPDLDAELATLEGRHASLEARAASAAADHAAATARRRVLLVENDDPDPSALIAADAACNEAEGRRGAAVDALGEIQGRMTALKARINQQRVNEGRQRQAADLEARATAIDGIMARIGTLAAEIAKERVALAETISTHALGCYDPPSRVDPGVGPAYLTVTSFDEDGQRITDRLDAAATASRLVGHVLTPVLPTLGIADAHQARALHGLNTITPTLGAIEDADASKVLITDRMRELAAEVRRGTDTPEPKAEDIKFGERQVYVTERCFYTDEPQHRPVFLSAWVNTVPVPVADRLLELGLALSPKSAEAKRLMDAKIAHDNRVTIAIDIPEPYTRENSRDLGFDLPAWKDAELQRRRAAWRAGLPS